MWPGLHFSEGVGSPWSQVTHHWDLAAIASSGWGVGASDLPSRPQRSAMRAAPWLAMALVRPVLGSRSMAPS